MRPSRAPVPGSFLRRGSPTSGARTGGARPRRLGSLLAVGCLVWSAACGGEDGPPQPSIAAFTADPSIVTTGAATTLTAVFANGTGSVDHGVGALESGVSKGTGTLAATTTFTLTVSGEDSSATRSLTVTVVPPPEQPVITAPPVLTAGASGTASVADQAGMSFEWTITGGSFSGGGGTAAGTAVTFTAGAAGTLALTCTATNAAGTGSAPAVEEVTVVPPPVISGFAATAPTLTAGAATSLVATFTGGTGTVDHGIGAVSSGQPASTGSLWDTTTFLLTVTNPAGDSVTAQATVSLVIVFTSEGDTFAPVIVVEGAPSILWTFADATTSTSSTPVKVYGSTGSRPNTLLVTPWSAVRRINLGYDAADGGSTVIERVPDQNVSAVEGLAVVRATLAQWCSSYNELTSLDFGGFTNLDTIECFHCEDLTSVNLADTPGLKRVSFEACRLASLDVSESPGLADLRAALNAFPTIGFGSGAFSDIWHVCIRENPQLGDRSLFESTARFPNIAGLLIWSSNQAGALRIPSSHPTRDFDLRANDNEYTSVDLEGALTNPLARGVVSLDRNPLSSVDLTGAVQLTELYLKRTDLTEGQLDGILATLDALGRARLGPADPTLLVVDLQENVSPSAAGRASAVSLASKGWAVMTSAWIEAPP